MRDGQDVSERHGGGVPSLFSGEVNMSLGERALSVAGGLGLAAIGAKPRPNMVLSAIAIVIGAALAIRGATGHCPVKSAGGFGA